MLRSAVGSGIAELNPWHATRPPAEFEKYLTASRTKYLIQELGRMNRYECVAPTTMPKRGGQLWKGDVAVRDLQIEHHGLLIQPTGAYREKDMVEHC